MMYFETRGKSSASVFGSFGIGINAIVNSQENKMTVATLWKSRLAWERREAREDDIANQRYFAFLERHLGCSLRHFMQFGDRYKILAWFRKYVVDICFWTVISYGFFWIVFTH